MVPVLVGLALTVGGVFLALEVNVLLGVVVVALGVVVLRNNVHVHDFPVVAAGLLVAFGSLVLAVNVASGWLLLTVVGALVVLYATLVAPATHVHNP
jgi:hypothetical protein